MPQPLTPLMEVRDIERIYRIGEVAVAALRGVSFQIFPGELVAIMGASGSGKSTLMGILGCLDKPSSGQYILMGADTSQLGEPELARLRSQSIGFVFQSFNLLPRTTTFENTMLPLFYTPSAGGSQAARAARVHQILQQMGIADREQNTSGQLSGGQQQRVAIARALVNQPAVLLADEPTGNLDSKTAREIMEMIVRLNREQGVTIILVTHDSDIAGYADRCITMRDGKILSDIRKTTSPSTNPTGMPPSTAIEHRAILGAASSHVNTMVISVALQAIARNKMRSLLTMLGVFIGVAALIAMVAVGKGANEAVQKQIATLGTNLIVVLPGSVITSGVRSGFGSASTLTENDAKAILRDDDAVAQVAYVIRQMAQVQYRDRNWTTLVGGVTPNFLPTTNWQIESGRSITDQDESTGAPIALIGRSVYQQLFTPDENPIGAKILIRGTPVEVVGLLASKGQTPFGMDQDDLVMIPFTAAERRVLGVAAPTQSLSATWSYVPPP
ncbi:MAG TPA: ABC transporter permease, partial [Edaphobacter sp.]|nr:ABC transporter permease [Edaphobacter sp.]